MWARLEASTAFYLAADSTASSGLAVKENSPNVAELEEKAQAYFDRYSFPLLGSGVDVESTQKVIAAAQIKSVLRNEYSALKKLLAEIAKGQNAVHMEFSTVEVNVPRSSRRSYQSRSKFYLWETFRAVIILAQQKKELRNNCFEDIEAGAKTDMLDVYTPKKFSYAEGILSQNVPTVLTEFSFLPAFLDTIRCKSSRDPLLDEYPLDTVLRILLDNNSMYSRDKFRIALYLLRETNVVIRQDADQRYLLSFTQVAFLLSELLQHDFSIIDLAPAVQETLCYNPPQVQSNGHAGSHPDSPAQPVLSSPQPKKYWKRREDKQGKK